MSEQRNCWRTFRFYDLSDSGSRRRGDGALTSARSGVTFEPVGVFALLDLGESVNQT